MPEVAELTGRQLDAAVAERVMGLELNTTIAGERGYYRNDHRGMTWRPARHYSTDIAAAWQVVEKLAHFYGLRKYVGYWTATWVTYPASPTVPMAHEAHASSAPEAICRAALKAVDSG